MDSEKDGIASHMLLLTLVAHAMDKSRLRHVLRQPKLCCSNAMLPPSLKHAFFNLLESDSWHSTGSA